MKLIKTCWLNIVNCYIKFHKFMSKPIIRITMIDNTKEVEKVSKLPPHHIKKNGVVCDLTPPVIGGIYTMRDNYEEFGIIEVKLKVKALGKSGTKVLFDNGIFKNQTCKLATFNVVYILIPEDKAGGST